MPNQITFKPGQPVVYNAPNGHSISATITAVRFAGARNADNDSVDVSWVVSRHQPHTVQVFRKDFDRITPFNQSLFLVL